MSFDDEIDDRRRQFALFRHAVVAELDAESLPRGELSARVEQLSQVMWRLPSGQERRFSVRTLWQWWIDYKQEGLEGLVPESRKSGPREITPELLEAAIAARKEIPSRSTATIIDVLELKASRPGASSSARRSIAASRRQAARAEF